MARNKTPKVDIMITEREKALWRLLSDIDTATIVYKPEDSKFLTYLYRTIAKRFDILELDGNELCEPKIGDES